MIRGKRKEKLAVVIIATGRYITFIKPLHESMVKFLNVDFDIHLWTNMKVDIDCHKEYMSHKGFESATFGKFNCLLEKDWGRLGYSNVMMLDADMLFLRPVGREIFSSGATVVQHPAYNKFTLGKKAPHCRNPESKAFIDDYDYHEYYAGAIVIFASGCVKKIVGKLLENKEEDDKNGVMADWHDESHMNHYWWKNPPAKILSNDYCGYQKRYNKIITIIKDLKFYRGLDTPELKDLEINQQEF